MFNAYTEDKSIHPSPIRLVIAGKCTNLHRKHVGFHLLHGQTFRKIEPGKTDKVLEVFHTYSDYLNTYFYT